MKIIDTVKIGSDTWLVLHISDGDKFFADDVAGISISRAKSIVGRLQEGVKSSTYSFGSDGILSGYEEGYIIVRRVKEPEMNEFGEVSP
jgi:hypothetical protein